jgi:hypothetical protein
MERVPGVDGVNRPPGVHIGQEPGLDAFDVVDPSLAYSPAQVLEHRR